jgi:DmsE family decaheme c-type cytochrome
MMLKMGNYSAAGLGGGWKSVAKSAKSADSPSSIKRISRIFLGLLVPTLLGLVTPVSAQQTAPKFIVEAQASARGAPFPATVEELSRDRQFNHAAIADPAISALADFARAIDGERPQTISLKDAQNPHPSYDVGAFASLRAFAQQLEGDQTSAGAPPQKIAEAGSLLEFLQQRNAPPSSTRTAPPTPPRAAPRGDRPLIAATYVGQQTCMGCHAKHAAEFGKTLMGRIASVKKSMNCETCHGPGSAHVKAGGGRGVGGIISFRPEDQSRTAEENNTICLACHQKGDRTMWQGSTHETRGVACTNCHTVMKDVSRKNQLKTASQPDTCYQCHQNKRAQQWRTAHMPVREGKMTCTSCHNPHGSYSEHLLKKATVNDTCYECHAEKRGPFLWEHPPVREDCLNCHDPHGSNNDFLLKVSRPRLCQQCHSGGQHNSNPRNPFVTLYAQGRECQHCHSNHHGSNNPSGPRFMR